MILGGRINFDFLRGEEVEDDFEDLEDGAGTEADTGA